MNTLEEDKKVISSYMNSTDEKEKKVFLFNSPPESGKDFISDYLEEMFGFSHVRFKEKLFTLVKELYTVTDIEWECMYTREYKDVPDDRLDGLSPRQAMIRVSENIIKPNFGKDYFGQSLSKRIISDTNRLYACSDSGFLSELLPVIENFGQDNVHIIRIHREGFTFERFNDSRRYLTEQELPHNTKVADVYNNGTLEEFSQKVIHTIADFLRVDDAQTS